MAAENEITLQRISEQLETMKSDQKKTHLAVVSLDIAIRGDGRNEPGLAAKVRENRRSIGGMKKGLWLAVAGLVTLAGEAINRWVWGE